MDNHDLEKRFKGLHYEVGRLPDYLSNSLFYWNLPHNVRRLVYLSLSSSNRYNQHKLYSSPSENLNVPSLTPFCNTHSIFVHVPKAAGISVGFSLYGRKAGDHRTIKDYKLCFTKRQFTSYFKFTFVRNPWDRLLSAYLFLKKGGRNEQDKKWALRYLNKYDSFDDFVTNWVNEDNIHLGLHFRPQCEFVCSKNGTPEVDFIGYFENIDNDFEYIKNKIGGGTELAFNNKTSDKKKDYCQYYNDKTRKIVESIYRKDIEIFGYNFEGTCLDTQLKQRNC